MLCSGFRNIRKPTKPLDEKDKETDKNTTRESKESESS